ncbi:MAG TPA: divalent-cation tolerance protein CutA, partial [Burkholderiaceae bacterium]|nr:divalent-cation tolerance protein CutA [Burkholderiaceae bacterium]
GNAAEPARYCIVQTTLDTEAAAEALARALVQAQLAACVQIQPIKSVYRWEEKLCCEPEYLLLIKTRTGRFEAIHQFIRERHSYTTPEIIQVPIMAGSEDYLRWLDAGTR